MSNLKAQIQRRKSVLVHERENTVVILPQTIPGKHLVPGHLGDLSCLRPFLPFSMKLASDLRVEAETENVNP